MTKQVKRAQVVLGLVWESVQFAIYSLKVNKLRTLLSLLGITIGVFSITLVLSLVGGLKNNIKEGLDALGGNTITIQREPWEVEEGQEWNWWDYIKRPPIEESDYRFVKDYSQRGEAVTFFTTFSGEFKYYRESLSGNVICITPDFDKIFNISTSEGRWFSPEELDRSRNVVYLGGVVAEKLFNGENPLGKEIRVDGSLSKVIGVAQTQGESLTNIFDFDNSILLPLGYGEMISGGGAGGAIAIIPKEDISQEDLISESRFLMRSHRRISPGEGDNFSINTMSYLSSTVDDLFSKINLIGWIIGGFALLVGGFGIANIVFVSVKERVPQIGIQKALGGERYIILVQFLSESALLSLVGGALGILIVLIISLILGNNSQVSLDMSLWVVLEGILIAMVVGLLSGLVPANIAANMDPVKAINSK